MRKWEFQGQRYSICPGTVPGNRIAGERGASGQGHASSVLGDTGRLLGTRREHRGGAGTPPAAAALVGQGHTWQPGPGVVPRKKPMNTLKKNNKKPTKTTEPSFPGESCHSSLASLGEAVHSLARVCSCFPLLQSSFPELSHKLDPSMFLKD